VEADVTHQGEDRNLTRPDLDARFKPWRSKLQPLIVTSMPRFWCNGDLEPHVTDSNGKGCLHLWSQHTTSGCWHVEASGLCECTAPRPYHKSIPRTPYFQKRERHQRDAIARLRQDPRFAPDTLVFISDVDEIWDPDALGRIEEALDESPWVGCEQRMYGFAIDYQHPEGQWVGTTVSRLSDLAPQTMRDSRNTPSMLNVKECGVHLSWMGSAEERARKLRTFSHAELVGKIDPQHLYENAKHSNGEQLQRVPFPGDEWWPAPMLSGEFVIPPSWRAP
jgi:hypothetical protein